MLLKFCDYCNKELEFENHNHWATHRRNCVLNPELKNIFNKISESKKLKNPISCYTFNCKKCNEEYKLDLRKSSFDLGIYKKYCSRKCANSRIWTKEDKKKKSISALNSDKIKENAKQMSIDRKGLHFAKNKITESKKKDTYSLVCKQCSKNFIHKSIVKTCSSKCRYELQSKTISGTLISSGVNCINWKNKKRIFNYKNTEIIVDSNLEKAAVIYLINIFKCDEIKRAKDILKYNYNGKVHNYNPDFYVKKDNKIYIIEVKLKWSESLKHTYNKMIPLKKEALDKFCKDKGYEMIWLDFDYDKELKIIYKQIRKMEVPN